LAPDNVRSWPMFEVGHKLPQFETSARDLSAVNSSLICLLVFMTAIALLLAHLTFCPRTALPDSEAALRLTIGNVPGSITFV
jgi:hypothetical protein